MRWYEAILLFLPPPQLVASFSPASQVAFGLELNALSDDQTPLPNAVTTIMEGLNKARVPFIRVCTLLTSVLSPHIQLLLLELMELCKVHVCQGSSHL